MKRYSDVLIERCRRGKDLYIKFSCKKKQFSLVGMMYTHRPYTYDIYIYI